MKFIVMLARVSLSTVHLPLGFMLLLPKDPDIFTGSGSKRFLYPRTVYVSLDFKMISVCDEGLLIWRSPLS